MIILLFIFFFYIKDKKVYPAAPDTNALTAHNPPALVIVM